MEITFAIPREFSFRRTIISHGWCQLLPFKIDDEKWQLTRTLDQQDTDPVTITIRATKRALVIKTSRRLNQAATKKMVADVRHMLRLDDNIAEFYRLHCRGQRFQLDSDAGCRTSAAFANGF